ncbi:MAG: hypothetical protein AAF684_08670, partial [Pseudomonadota bacterium]
EVWSGDVVVACAPLSGAFGRIAGVRAALTTPAAKADLAARSGAAAADMETAGVATAALAAGLPLYVFRAVSDGPEYHVPACALAGLRPDGTTAIGPVLAGLIRSPRDLPALIRLGRGYAAALRTLSGFGPRLLALL